MHKIIIILTLALTMVCPSIYALGDQHTRDDELETLKAGMRRRHEGLYQAYAESLEQSMETCKQIAIYAMRQTKNADGYEIEVEWTTLATQADTCVQAYRKARNEGDRVEKTFKLFCGDSKLGLVADTVGGKVACKVSATATDVWPDFADATRKEFEANEEPLLRDRAKTETDKEKLLEYLMEHVARAEMRAAMPYQKPLLEYARTLKAQIREREELYKVISAGPLGEGGLIAYLKKHPLSNP